MRVLVNGSKDYDKRDRVRNVLSDFHESTGITCIITGGLKAGVDYAARLWAEDHNVPVMEIKMTAALRKRSKKAGMMRNFRFLDEGRPDIIFHFPPGTPDSSHLLSKAQQTGILAAKIIDDS